MIRSSYVRSLRLKEGADKSTCPCHKGQLRSMMLGVQKTRNVLPKGHTHTHTCPLIHIWEKSPRQFEHFHPKDNRCTRPASLRHDCAGGREHVAAKKFNSVITLMTRCFTPRLMKILTATDSRGVCRAQSNEFLKHNAPWPICLTYRQNTRTHVRAHVRALTHSLSLSLSLSPTTHQSSQAILLVQRHLGEQTDAPSFTRM